MIYIGYSNISSLIPSAPEFVVLEHDTLYDIHLLREEYEREFLPHLFVLKEYQIRKNRIEVQFDFLWAGPIPENRFDIAYLSGNPSQVAINKAEELEKWFKEEFKKALCETESKKIQIGTCRIEFGFTKWLVEHKGFFAMSNEIYHDDSLSYTKLIWEVK